MLKDCKYFEGTGNFCSRVTAMRCDDLPDCEFKYIEELKAEIKTLKKVKDFACINLNNYIADNNKLKAENATYKANAEAVQKYITQNEQLKTHIDGLEKKNAKLKAENARLKEELTTYGATGVCEVCSDKANKLADKYLGCLREIKEIAEAPSPYIDNFGIKTATEVGYDYATICNELELRLHKVLELITKAESEEE